MENKNEFEELYNADDFNEGDEILNNDETQEDLVASGNEGLEYDLTKAPTTTKSPERTDLDGQEVVIEDVKVILPKSEREWDTAKKNKNVRYKPCQFILFYNKEGQREYYSGVKVFPREAKGKELYSDPTIQNNALNQASELKKVYADFKNKKPEEVSLREFFSFLKSKPKAMIAGKEFEFDGKKTKKNIVVKFL